MYNLTLTFNMIFAVAIYIQCLHALIHLRLKLPEQKWCIYLGKCS